MRELRSVMLIGAIVASVLGLILILQGSVTSAGGLFPQWGPGMMGRGMGPGMMGRVNPDVIGPWRPPVPGEATPANTGNDLALPGTVLLVGGGAALLGWWWAGRPFSPRDRGKETPMEIASRRYIDGEITLSEFDEIVQGLLSSEARETKPARRKKG